MRVLVSSRCVPALNGLVQIIAILISRINSNSYIACISRSIFVDACHVQMIGSCCSLVCRLYQSDPIGQRLFVSAAASGIAHASDETDVSLQVVTSVSPIAALLLSVVLLDTSGVPSHRADVDAVAHCIGTAAAAAPNVSAAAPVASAQPLAVIDHAALQTLHSRLLRHRRDVLCLTCAELLRKDAKFLLGGGGGVRIGVSSVSLPMRVVAAKADEENRCGQASASAALSDSSAPTEQSDRELRALVGALRRFGDALDIVVLMTVYSRADFPRLAPLPTPAPSDGNTNTGMAPSVDGGSTSGAAPSVSPLVRELLVVCAPAAVERHFGGSAAAWRAWCEALRAALEATAVLQLPGALSFAAHAPVAVVSSSSASSPAPAEAAAASTSAAPVDDSAPIVHLWASQSATATRKQVLPALETFLATRPPPRTVDGSAAVAHL